MTYEVALELPEGFAGATPSLSLRYSSMNGNEALGIGWDLLVPHIERFTLRGQPAYDRQDVFAADGSEELVRVQSPANQHVYRARFEGGFVRYTWHPDAQGRAGYWIAEYPDSSRAFFGAYHDAEGAVVPVPGALARATDGADEGVFRYMLVKTEDSLGHAIRYHYNLDERTPQLDRIEYLFAGDPASTTDPRYAIKMHYGERSDRISNALPGFELALSERLEAVELLSHNPAGTSPTLLRRYVLDYEEAPAGTSRLKRVRQFGLEGREELPVVFTFEYSSSLDLACVACEKPFVFSMGALSSAAGFGLDFANGRATLVDINGDALPDLLDTTEGRHHFFINQMQANGDQAFGPAAPSQRDTSAFWLEQATVQTLDVNGDGLADIANVLTGDVLCNGANRDLSDWTTAACPNINLGSVAFDDDGDADPKGIRFLDANGDRRIDVMRASTGSTGLWLHTDQGFTEVPSPNSLEYGFDDNTHLQLSDINGDGLLDAALVDGKRVWYRLHLGSGAFAPFHSAPLSWRDSTQETEVPIELWDLQDLNGDGLDDVVAVFGSRVYFALQRAGEFLAMETIDSSDLGGDEPLPVRDGNTTVLFADMNGSGTTDVVWINPDDASVRVLELFAIRPNLLTRIENGLGAVQTVEYGTSSQQQARDRAAGTDWRTHLPQPVNLVTATELYATLAPDVRLRVERNYHHGFYDGVEKRYRGFAKVEETIAASATQEGRLRAMDYDVGNKDPYYAGRLVRDETFGERADKDRYPIRKVVYGYKSCPVAQAESFEPDYAYPVDYVCGAWERTTLQEGQPEAAWVTTETQREYDLYGNVILDANLGVVPSEGAACRACDALAGTVSGACGSGCSGDEEYVVTEFNHPVSDTGGSWNLRAAARTLRYGVANPADLSQPAEGARVAETLMYYDGKAFTGNPGGLTTGLLTRVCERVAPEASPDCQGEGWIQSLRVEHDDHGNVITELDPLGRTENLDGHRRSIQYDKLNLKPEKITLFLSREGQNYQLSRTIRYDAEFYQPECVSRWLLENAPVASTPANTFIGYDDFGRRSLIAAPGDSLDAPTQRFVYELGDPVTRIIVHGRSESNQATDLENIQCVDGLGRVVQSRTRLEKDLYQVTGFHEVNPQGATVRAYQAYQGGAECDEEVPQGVLFSSTFYDGSARPLRVTEPDGGIYGSASDTVFEYAPLVTTTFDPQDNDPDHAITYNTPHRQTMDGLGRVVALERFLFSEGETGRVRALYDELDYLVGYLDPGTNRKQQAFDLLGRVVEVQDPNAGRLGFEYDSAGNQIRRTDGRAKSVETRYDGVNRPVEQFDPDDRDATLIQMFYDYSVDCEECTAVEGNLARVTYPLDVQAEGIGQDEFGFDLRERATFFARTLEGHRFVIRSDFDNADRVTRQRYPDGTELLYHYDAASRLAELTSVVEGVEKDILEDAEYDVRGQIGTWHFGNGVLTSYDYDDLARLTTLETTARQTTLQALDYTYDRVGNITHVSDRVDTGDASVHYEHDAWYRTVRATSPSNGEVLDFGFDRLDNLTSRVSSFGEASRAHVGELRYGTSRPNALGAAGNLSFDYDEAGQLVARGGTSLSWDYKGRLTRTASDAGREGYYAYAQDVERVLERHDGSVVYYIGPQFEVRDGMSVTYARTARQRVARISSDSLATTVLDDTNANGRLDVGDAWSMGPAGEASVGYLHGCARRLLLEVDGPVMWLHDDHLQSLTLATTDTGEVRGRRSFFPTGQVRAERGFVDTYGYTGQRSDPTTGFTHFLFRDLDTLVGRWASPDPLFSVVSSETLDLAGESTTAFAYVAGRFGSSSDPHGLMTRTVAASGGAGRRSATRSPAAGRARSPNRSSVRTTRGRSRSNDAASSRRSAGEAGYDLALGHRSLPGGRELNLLHNFSNQVNALNWFSAPREMKLRSTARNRYTKIAENVHGLMQDARRIKFNLRGVDLVKFWEYRNDRAQRGTVHELSVVLPGEGRFTEWELVTILERPELLRKTTFYDFDRASGRYAEWYFPY